MINKFIVGASYRVNSNLCYLPYVQEHEFTVKSFKNLETFGSYLISTKEFAPFLVPYHFMENIDITSSTFIQEELDI
mgnify:CR=1 FL=1